MNLAWWSALFDQTVLIFDLPADRLPQAQVEPLGPLFSEDDREHVHSPAGRAS